MKLILIAICSLCVAACSSSVSKYQYCSVAHIDDPAWVKSDRTKGYLISKVGVRHTREAERDITRVVKLSLVESLYADVHSYRQSYSNSDQLAVNQSVNVATNVVLKNVKTEFERAGSCLVAWATVSLQDAEIALNKSHPINSAEHKAWLKISNSSSSRAYREHLKKYPRGLYSETARARIEFLEQRHRQKTISNSAASPTTRMLLHLINSIAY